MNGDFNGHGVAIWKANSSKAEKTKVWGKMKGMIETDMEMVRRQFPNASILPTIGNNDVIVHDETPCKDDIAEIYYGDLYNLWFPQDDSPAGWNHTAAKETFSQGGYYRYDFPD